MTHDIGSEQARRLRPASERGVVRAKLVPPRLPHGSVSRPGLLDTLRAGRGRTLTLVCAPAGYGKTTLLAEWAQTDLLRRFAWVSLDAGDCEPERFWTPRRGGAVRRRARRHRGDGGRDAGPAQPDRRRRAAAAVRRAGGRLADGADDLVLVLDDYHRAETPEVSALLAEFMRYRPERVQLVVSTRSDPALGVARLRAGGDLVEVRADALRFDERRGGALLRRHRAGGPDADGGAPAGGAHRRLAGPAAAGLPAHAGARARHVHRAVLRGQPARRRLPRPGRARPARPARPGTSCSGSRSSGASTARCATRSPGPTGSGAMLADLERANLFISVDSAGEWYHPHQLFTEALRVELTRSQPTLVPVLHARAAGWLEAAGDVEAATDHAIAARDLHLASRLVAGQVQPMSASGRSANIQRWLAALVVAGRRCATRSWRSSVPCRRAWRTSSTRRRTGWTSRAPATSTPATRAGCRSGSGSTSWTALMGVNDVARAQEAAQRACRRRAEPELARHRAGVPRSGAVPGGAG